jgi:hypothetical protein
LGCHIVTGLKWNACVSKIEQQKSLTQIPFWNIWQIKG